MSVPDQKHGFQDRVTTDIYPADFAWTPDWEAADERIDKWYHNMQTVKESGMAVATFQTDYDDEVEFAARRWLVDRGRDAAAGNGTPFCMVASFIHPHDPYVAKPEFWNLYDDADIDMPEFTLAPEDQDPFSRRVMDGIEASYIPLTEEEVRRAPCLSGECQLFRQQGRRHCPGPARHWRIGQHNCHRHRRSWGHVGGTWAVVQNELL